MNRRTQNEQLIVSLKSNNRQTKFEETGSGVGPCTQNAQTHIRACMHTYKHSACTHTYIHAHIRTYMHTRTNIVHAGTWTTNPLVRAPKA